MSFTIDERPDDAGPRLLGEPSPQLVEYDAGPDLDPRPDMVTLRHQMADTTSRSLTHRIELTTLFGQSSFYRKPRHHFSLALDGIDDYVKVEGSEHLDAVTHELTCEVWFRPESRVGGHRVLIHYPFLIEYRGGLIRALWHPGAADEPWIPIGGDGYYSVNRWYHVALTYSAYTSWATLYVNGRATDTVEVPPLEPRELPWYFGGHASQQRSQNLFQGMIDEVRLWDRTLDRQAIRQNMHEVQEPAGLVAVWDFTPTTDRLVPNLIDDSIGDQAPVAPGRIVGEPRWRESTRPRAAHLRRDRDFWQLREAFVEGRSRGQLDEAVFSGVRPPASDAERVIVMELFAGMTADAFVQRYLNGDRLVVREDPTTGESIYSFEAIEPEVPYLFLEETYQLTSTPYRLGAGRVLRAISLLPGEETKLRIQPPGKARSDADGGDCILDSGGPVSDAAFSAVLAAEVTGAGGSSKLARSARPGSDTVRAGIARVNAARERFSREVLAALAKHVATVSARRTLHIETGSQGSNAGGIDSARRSIRNPNEGRTLHYVFRQLTQEYVSALSLVDVRIGVGYGGVPTAVAPLHQIDLLLESFVLPHARAEIKQTILEQVLGRIPDYRGAVTESLVEKRDEFWRVGQVESEVLLSPGGATGIKVPGIILGVTRTTLRTEDAIVEGLLGTNPVLDHHTRRMESEKVREQQLANDFMAQEIDKERLRFEMVQEAAETGEAAETIAAADAVEAVTVAAEASAVMEAELEAMAPLETDEPVDTDEPLDTDASIEPAPAVPLEAEARERLSEIRRTAEKKLEERGAEEPLEEPATPGPNQGG